jgi:hypothetical protein
MKDGVLIIGGMPAATAPLAGQSLTGARATFPKDVVFLVEGRSIKHHAEDRGETRGHPAPTGK